MSDYYSVLGVSRNASDVEIRKAYKKLAMQWHPDKNPDNKDFASTKFKEISEAYGVLSDPKKKKMYDMYGKDGMNNRFAESGFTTNIDPNDIFASVFGNAFSGMPFGQKTHTKYKSHGFDFGNNFKQQENIIKYIECTLEELYSGIVKYDNINGRQYKIDILAGWKDGTKISYDDVTFIVKEKRHNTYKRDGDDLIIEKKITLIEALKGFKMEIPLITTKKQVIECGPLTGNTNAHIINGCGMLNRKSNNYGNMIVKFNIVLTGIEYHTKQSIINILESNI